MPGQVEGYADTPANAVACILNFLFFAFSVIPFIYVFTFLFTKHTAAWITLIFLTLLSGVVMIIAGWILEFFDATRKPNFYLGYILYRLFPPYNVGRSILDLGINNINRKLQDAGILPASMEVVKARLQMCNICQRMPQSCMSWFQFGTRP